MSMALEIKELGKRYGRKWALRDCTVELPTGRVVALVGPNGAGKTTLLQLAVGLLKPSVGEVRVFGCEPHKHAREILPRVGFLAQDHPLYKHFTVADLLKMGRKMNPYWDQWVAEERLSMLDIDSSWEVQNVTLEEIVLAYMRQSTRYQQVEALPTLEENGDDVRLEESGDGSRKEGVNPSVRLRTSSCLPSSPL